MGLLERFRGPERDRSGSNGDSPLSTDDVDGILSSLSSPTPSTREAAATAVLELLAENPEAAPRTVDALVDSTRRPGGSEAETTARRRSALALARLAKHDPEPIERRIDDLEPLLSDEDAHVSGSVAGVLASVALDDPERVEPYVPALVSLLTPARSVTRRAEERHRAGYALYMSARRAGDDRRRTELLEAAGSTGLVGALAAEWVEDDGTDAPDPVTWLLRAVDPGDPCPRPDCPGDVLQRTVSRESREEDGLLARLTSAVGLAPRTTTAVPASLPSCDVPDCPLHRSEAGVHRLLDVYERRRRARQEDRSLAEVRSAYEEEQ